MATKSPTSLGGQSSDSNQDGRPDECFVPVPTASSWGVVAIALLLLIAAKLSFRRAAD